jgi:TatD DNase family protein
LLRALSRQVPGDHPIHFHCYSGNAAQAGRWLQHFPRTKFGFTGGLTLPGRARDRASEVLRFLAIDQILLETDAPYMSPRGCSSPNHPWNILRVAEEVLAIRPELGTTRAVASYARLNARDLYRLQ